MVRSLVFNFHISERLSKFKMCLLNKCLVLVMILVALGDQIKADEDTIRDDGTDPAFETSDRDFNKSYRTIDSYLSDNVSTDDIDLNMKVASEWLSKDLKKDPTKNERLIDALELFISLRDTYRGKKCDQNGYDILFKNLLATENCGLGKRSERRIDRVVYKFLHDHARNCQRTYPVNFEKIYANMDPIRLGYVEFFLNEKNLQNFLGDSKNIQTFFSTLVKNQQRIQGKFGSRMAFDAINALSVNDEDGKSLYQSSIDVRKEKFRKLFERYIIEPCRFFVNELGPDVFVPSRFEAMFFHRLDESNILFYKSWARFRVCTYVLDNEDNFTYALVNGVANARVNSHR